MKKSSEQPKPLPSDELNNLSEEKPDAWWYRVYAAVMVTTVLVITALWLFSRHFS